MRHQSGESYCVERCTNVTDASEWSSDQVSVGGVTTPPIGANGAQTVDVHAPVDAEIRRAMLGHMLLARGIDVEAVRLQNQGALDLWLSCRGQEAAQVASAMAIGDAAVIFPSYREHAVAVVRGVDAVSLVAQWAGRTFCGWNPRQHRFFPYTLVVGAQALHAVGYAIGGQIKGMAETVVVYIGDGATSQGDVSEAMNLAAVESAPVLFVCQNNGWAISKPSREQMLTPVATRAAGFGIRSWSIAGDEPDSTYQHCLTASRLVEATGSPGFIELRTTRTAGHSSSDAHTLYRDPAELATAAANDPVSRYRETLLADGVVDDAWLDRIDADIELACQRLLEAFGR
jgi:2-oxoisovalerate dehydrogenase E1 component alpha subunit